MKKYHVAFRAALISAVAHLAGPAFPAENPPASTIKIAAWNLEWFPGGKPDATAEEAAARMTSAREELQKINPDIFIAEEIRDWNAFANVTAVVTNLRVNAVSAFRDHNTGILAHQQVGIASKMPVRAAWTESWRATIPALPRGFTLSAIENPKTGKLLLVYGVHLKSNRTTSGAALEEEHDARWRDESISELLAHIDDMERVTFKGEIQGVVVAGDFNTNEDGQFADHVVQTMVEHGFYNTWSHVPADKRLTWHGEGNFKPTTFDYILTKGVPDISATMLSVSNSISDHNPVIISLPN